jgi:hypothetical protein
VAQQSTWSWSGCAGGRVMDEFGDPFWSIGLCGVPGERQDAEARGGKASEELRRLSRRDEIDRSLREHHGTGDRVEVCRDVRSDGPYEQPPEMC